MKAPKITPADVEATIASEHYFTAREGVLGMLAGDGVSATVYEQAKAAPLPLSLLTFCVLVLRNGHTVTGQSYCADPAEFNAETGRIEARKRALDELWPMVVYAERGRLAAPPFIALTPEEVHSGMDRVRWAEGLIKQLPEDHDGRNSWLLNYGRKG